MGKLEVKGSATKTVDYDLMKIELNFLAKEDTPVKASEKVMRECEEFLAILKKSGFDISSISLKKDEVDKYNYFSNDDDKDCYRANRIIVFEAKFDMKIINDIRAITHKSNAQVTFNVQYRLSNEGTIRQELMAEALKDAKKQAEVMAAAIDQKVVGLISANKNAGDPGAAEVGQVLCMSLCSEQDIETYDNSNELSSSNETYTETIYTTWEIA
ncbi:MAG: SIMPL domain-containing protein [Lachnospiraceae bacterium]|nr:SIMPL domain-containing protein [Lachnospiraceae bacterium]